MERGIERFFDSYPMPEIEANELKSFMELKHFAKGECVAPQGELNINFYIIQRGIWSSVRTNPDGSEITMWFAFSGECVFNMWGFVRDEISPVSIISETDSTAWVVDRTRLEEIAKIRPHVAHTVHRIVFSHMLNYENRLLNMSMPQHAKDRYMWLEEKYPLLFQEVSLGRIASYLGVTHQSLSRIRRQLFTGK